MISNIPFCSHIKNIDPTDYFCFDEPIPIRKIMRNAYEGFRFEGWDFEDRTSNKEAQENSKNIGSLFSDVDSEESRNARNLLIDEFKKKLKSIGNELDSAIDIAIGLAKLRKESAYLKNKDALPLLPPLLHPLPSPPIDRSFQEGQSVLHLFYWFTQWLDEYFEDEDGEEFSQTLLSGRILSVVNITGAMALLALDKATGAALRGETWATSHLLLDACELVDRGSRMMEGEYEYLIKQGEAKKRAQKRHEKTYAIKEFALNRAEK